MLAKKITTKDESGNIKGIQIYRHNEKGDPIYFRKTDAKGAVICDWEYEYTYDDQGRRITMTIKDLQKNTATTMEYEY